MQATQHRLANHGAERRELDRPRRWTVLVEAKVSSRIMVVLEIFLQRVSEMKLVKDDHVIQTIATNRANDSFDIGILPGRPS